MARARAAARSPPACSLTSPSSSRCAISRARVSQPRTIQEPAMRMMTKLLTTTLLGSATFWACGIDHASAPAREATGHQFFEDGPGSGSDPGPGSDPTQDPEPDPGGDACTCDPPA